MDYLAESRITARPEYLHVDFGSSSRMELCEGYRNFARLCAGSQINGALLTAGDNDPEAHRQLGGALLEMARGAALGPDFKLALVPSTVPIQAVYRDAQQALRAIGLNAWVFDTAGEAVEWLEGRAACGPTAS